MLGTFVVLSIAPGSGRQAVQRPPGEQRTTLSGEPRNGSGSAGSVLDARFRKAAYAAASETPSCSYSVSGAISAPFGQVTVPPSMKKRLK